MAKKKFQPDQLPVVAELERRVEIMREIQKQHGAELRAAARILNRLKKDAARHKAPRQRQQKQGRGKASS
jgi:hypothetical protein